jgi:hypothetical protein
MGAGHSKDEYRDFIRPSDLERGCKFRLAFVTSQLRDANSSAIADYNAFVSLVANSAPILGKLHIDWRAIASTQSVDARDNTGTNPNVGVGTPIYNLRGRRIASSNADLWDGSIANALNIDENLTVIEGPTNTLVWTGSRSSALHYPNLELGQADAVVGNTIYTGHQWIDQLMVMPRATLLRLYAVSDVLTL